MQTENEARAYMGQHPRTGAIINALGLAGDAADCATTAIVNSVEFVLVLAIAKSLCPVLARSEVTLTGVKSARVRLECYGLPKFPILFLYSRVERADGRSPISGRAAFALLAPPAGTWGDAEVPVLMPGSDAHAAIVKALDKDEVASDRQDLWQAYTQES